MRWPNDRLLAENVDGIDIVLGGHDHDYNLEKVRRRLRTNTLYYAMPPNHKVLGGLRTVFNRNSVRKGKLKETNDKLFILGFAQYIYLEILFTLLTIYNILSMQLMSTNIFSFIGSILCEPSIILEVKKVENVDDFVKHPRPLSCWGSL